MFTKIIRTILATIMLLTASESLRSISIDNPLSFGANEIANAQEPEPTDDPPLQLYGRDSDTGDDPEYVQAIQNTAAMVWNENAQHLASQYGFNILNVTWEDTGRYYNSSVGPNISDVTIQVQLVRPQRYQYLVCHGTAFLSDQAATDGKRAFGKAKLGHQQL